QVTRPHFLGALRGLTPSSQREGINPARPLPPHLSALLSPYLASMAETLQVQFPQGSHGKDLEGASDEGEDDGDWSDEDCDRDSSESEDQEDLGAGKRGGGGGGEGGRGGGGGGGGASRGGWGKGEASRQERRGGGDVVKDADRGGGSGLNGVIPSGGGVAVGGGDIGGGGVGGGMGVGVGSAWVHRPRLALHGPPGCGQSQLAAAALHALDGVPVHSLALHSLHGDPSRTAEAALISRFVEARRNVPSVLYLPGAHQWWDGEDTAVHPHLRTLLVNLLEDIPDTWPILVVSTWETKSDDGEAAGPLGGFDAGGAEAYGYRGGGGAHASRSGKQLISALLGDGGGSGRLGDGGGGGGGGGGAGGERAGWNGAVEMRLSGDEQREQFVTEMLSTLSATLRKAFCSRGSKGGRAKKAPPPPLPLAPAP
ncbi:unnamed protein product, partial [Laminaria digitata]